MAKKCTSCSIEVNKGSTTFKCPSCEKTQIVRCFDCRKRATRYKCPECSFSGPN